MFGMHCAVLGSTGSGKSGAVVSRMSGAFMEKRSCVVCAAIFYVLPQCLNQMYCSAPHCQQMRKNRWQQVARKDPDYQENQQRAQKKWCASHPDYWRTYRAEHAEYTQKNRDQQAARNAKRGKKG